MKKELFSLGDIYPSDFLKPGEKPRCEPVELKLVMDDNGIVMLDQTAPKEVMWGEKYWYRSGINASMKSELKDIVDSILSVMEFQPRQIFLDVACNDGTLLSFVPNTFFRIGIDPAGDSFSQQAIKHAEIIQQDYFSAEVYKRCKLGKVKVLTNIAMFYDLQDPVSFIRDVFEILEKDGLWVMQMSYTPLMLHQVAFDNICHEHARYYSLFNIKKLLEDNGFYIMDCRLNEVNGGSFRLYIMKKTADHSKFGTQPHRDICHFRINSLLSYEKEIKIDKPETWLYFYHAIRDLKEEVVSFIKREVDNGKAVYGYGASTKGNTLLQYFGLDNTYITAIADRNPDKWGLVTVGTNIPIVSEEDMRKEQPDYLLILPWHFIGSFKERESEYLRKGGAFIVPCPEFEIITA